MNVETGTSQTSHPGSTMRRRILTTEVAAWLLSLGLHGLLFGGLYHLVMRADAMPEALPAADARLTSAAPARQLPTAPIRLLAPQSMAQALPPLSDLEAPPALSSEINALAELPPADLPTPPEMRNAPSLIATREPIEAATATFFGEPGDARDIVYVLDISEDLRGYFPETLSELRASINNLKATQRFHIVLAKPSGVISELPPRRLVPANARYKQEAAAFLDAQATWPQPGGADPVKAMQRAFAVSPELIYFMSNGDYAPTTPLESTINALNPSRGVRITTIGFEPPAYGRSLLARIARTNGGQSRIISPSTGGNPGS